MENDFLEENEDLLGMKQVGDKKMVRIPEEALDHLDIVPASDGLDNNLAFVLTEEDDVELRKVELRS